ncbi:hypothetical protein [Spirosoma pollinicola]|uniref:Uncharacterized protein n=1 Tax=Spirosoma pollinicola TaxID=2057025 RepID=A0A2K8YV05_9BACT|nr:hypothetical protein [Spirosoma pollinicola]AUD01451.1 hypothetical protein CWM47_06275 [Spirosoma pollinicola]
MRSLSLEATGHYVAIHWFFCLMYMFTRIYDWLLVSLLRLAYYLIKTTIPSRPTPQKENMDVDWLGLIATGYEGNVAKSFISPESSSNIHLRP